MIALVESTIEGTEEIKGSVADSVARVGATASRFGAFVADFQEMTGMVQRIAGTIGEAGGLNRQMNARIAQVAESATKVHALMAESAQQVDELRVNTESMQGVLAEFRTGGTVFDSLVEATSRLRQETADCLAACRAKGVDVFDHDYRQIADSNPPRFNTRYDQAVDQALRALFDRTLSSLDGCVYALAVDCNGYAPAHNAAFSRPPTGDYETDLKSCRDKRIFDDPVGRKLAANTQPFLFQSYLRDTGEVINDLSMPIYIDGRHWGAVRVGFENSRLV
jgi:methyl-accepting chemotaxis protein